MFLYQLKLVNSKAIGFYAFFFMTVTFVSTVCAQKTITITEFLSATKVSIQSIENDEALAVINNYNYNLPLIKAV
jgi:hypothetical protein